MKESSCILWRGAKSKKGYGVVRINYVLHYVHRLSYTLHKGSIPRGLMVCHSCDNPSCFNPQHLFLGTAKDNTDDMNRKNRGIRGRSPLLVLNTKTGQSVEYVTQQECADAIGVDQATVSYAKQRGSLIAGLYKITNSQKPLPL